MKCRGTEVRKKIVEEYNVTPVAHIKLLAGQTKRSDAEADITKEALIKSSLPQSLRRMRTDLQGFLLLRNANPARETL